MRQGQQNRRGRGRSNSSSNNSNSNNNNNNNHNNGRKQQNPLARNYESNGPDVKIRGSAAQIAEKYMTLARDASSAGDIVTAENYLQHAEHYNRIIMAAQAQVQAQVPSQPHSQQPQPAVGLQPHDSAYAPPVQRVPTDDGASQRDPQPQPQLQPQPQILPAASSEQPVIPTVVSVAAEQDQPLAASAEADGEQAGRRRRRRYPGAASRTGANGGENATAAPDLAGEARPVNEALA